MTSLSYISPIRPVCCTLCFCHFFPHNCSLYLPLSPFLTASLLLSFRLSVLFPFLLLVYLSPLSSSSFFSPTFTPTSTHSQDAEEARARAESDVAALRDMHETTCAQHHATLARTRQQHAAEVKVCGGDGCRWGLRAAVVWMNGCLSGRVDRFGRLNVRSA